MTNPTTPEGRRTFWRRAPLVAFLGLALATGYATYQAKEATDQVKQYAQTNRQLLKRIINEGNERRQQSCTADERKHLATVDNLQKLYIYIEGLSPEEASTNFNKAIIASVPDAEEDAYNDNAPEYCDVPGVGLPEPDPKVPDRSKKVRKYVNQVLGPPATYGGDLRTPDSRASIIEFHIKPKTT